MDRVYFCNGIPPGTRRNLKDRRSNLLEKQTQNFSFQWCVATNGHPELMRGINSGMTGTQRQSVAAKGGRSEESEIREISPRIFTALDQNFHSNMESFGGLGVRDNQADNLSIGVKRAFHKRRAIGAVWSPPLQDFRG